jgi:hypothetical protein
MKHDFTIVYFIGIYKSSVTFCDKVDDYYVSSIQEDICDTRPRNYLLSSLFYNSTFI